MKYFWFSFSYKAKNQGICVVQSNNEQNAYIKIQELNLIPEKHDHVLCLSIDTMNDDQHIELDKFYTSEEMMKLGYNSVKS